MIGIVAYTLKPFKGIHTLAERYRDALPDSRIISVDDPAAEFYVKNIQLLNQSFQALICIEHYFEELLLTQYVGKLFLVPMWEYLGRAQPMFARLSGTICHSRKTQQLVSRYLPRIPNVLVPYPMRQMFQPADSEQKISDFFMINGHPARNRKRVDLLDQANLDDRHSITVRTVRPLDVQTHHLRVLEGFVEARAALYSTGQVQVYPSMLEGLGMAVYEALEHGVPTLIADLPPINEGYNPEWLFRPGSAVEIRKRLDSFSGQLLAPLQEWIVEFIKQRSFENFAAQVEEIV